MSAYSGKVTLKKYEVCPEQQVLVSLAMQNDKHCRFGRFFSSVCMGVSCSTTSVRSVFFGSFLLPAPLPFVFRCFRNIAKETVIASCLSVRPSVSPYETITLPLDRVL